MKRLWVKLILVMALLPVSLMSGVVNAESSTKMDWVAGKHYKVLPYPVRTRDASKVEVVELFWYGCGHCYKFEPMFEAWAKQQAADVLVLQQPAMWNKTMRVHAHAYYTAQALGVLDTTHMPLFKALNVDRKRLADKASLQAFFVKLGVDGEKFAKTFDSFGVNSQVNLADSRARSYKMQGTPEIVVNGKYRVASGLAGSQAGMLEVASYLIEKERKAMAK